MLWALVLASFGSVLHDRIVIRRLRRAKKHDSILYRFCRVRDSIAELAIAGKISEATRIFEFFYLDNAHVIHNHGTSGVCFSSLLREIDRTIEPLSKEETEWIELLVSEIRQADEKVRRLVEIYDQALFDAIVSSLNLIMVDRLLRAIKANSEAIVSFLGHLFFIPRSTRTAFVLWQGLQSSTAPAIATQAVA